MNIGDGTPSEVISANTGTSLTTAGASQSGIRLTPSGGRGARSTTSTRARSHSVGSRSTRETFSLRRAAESCRVREVEHYGSVLRETLCDLAPGERSEPCIVLLTPGVYNSAFYEHMFLAHEIGAELVEGRDLLVNDGFVYMRTTAGLRRVDVI